MTLTELRYIVAVARERHFGRAAEACHVSQPTLSVAIKKLEEELEVKLFERGGAEVTVTPLGEEIVPAQTSGLFLYGTSTSLTPFGNGFKCVGSPTRRLPITAANAVA